MMNLLRQPNGLGLMLKSSCLVSLSMFTGDVLCQFLDDMRKTKIEPSDDGGKIKRATVIEAPQEVDHNSSELSMSVVTKDSNNSTMSSFLANRWDHKRSLIMGTTGLCVSGPLGFLIFSSLDRFVPGNSSKASLKKTLLNACIAPLSICVTFSTVTLLKGGTLTDAKNKIASDLVTTYTTSIFYWPVIGFLNFRFVPLQYRPVVGSIAGIIWNVYMAGQTNREVAQTQTSSDNALDQTVTKC